VATYSYSCMQLHLHCLLLWCLHLSVCTYSVYKHIAPTFPDRYQSSTIDLLFCSTATPIVASLSFPLILPYLSLCHRRPFFPIFCLSIPIILLLFPYASDMFSSVSPRFSLPSSTAFCFALLPVDEYAEIAFLVDPDVSNVNDIG
jgi:hypothetical protein